MDALDQEQKDDFLLNVMLRSLIFCYQNAIKVVLSLLA